MSSAPPAVRLDDDERIDGENCYAVPFGEHHLNDPAYLGWLRDQEVVRTLDRPEYWDPVPFEEVAGYCRALFASNTDYFFALYEKADDAFIGTLRAGHIDWRTRTADVGIMIGHRRYWGRGIGLAAVQALSIWLFDRLDMRRLTGGAMAINPAMIRIFEKLGFQHEARYRQSDLLPEGGYCDHIYLGCFRDEFDGAAAALAGADGLDAEPAT